MGPQNLDSWGDSEEKGSYTMQNLGFLKTGFRKGTRAFWFPFRGCTPASALQKPSFSFVTYFALSLLNTIFLSLLLLCEQTMQLEFREGTSARGIYVSQCGREHLCAARDHLKSPLALRAAPPAVCSDSGPRCTPRGVASTDCRPRLSAPPQPGGNDIRRRSI